MKRWIGLALVLVLLAAGCGGKDSQEASTQTYYDPTKGWQDTTTTSSDYYNLDGSPPQCVTLAINQQQACNTDEELVLAARSINSSETTMDEVITYYRGQCLNAGYGMRECFAFVQQITTLVAYNVTHGVPQHR